MRTAAEISKQYANLVEREKRSDARLILELLIDIRQLLIEQRDSLRLLTGRGEKRDG